MRYLLAGASGFLGTALRVRLASEGQQAVRLVRREPATATEFRWDPDQGTFDPAAFSDVDVVVNLCGVGIADRPWTKARRELIRTSRTNPTRTLANALAQRAEPRPVLIQSSAIGWYGTQRTDTPHTEDSPAASDYVGQLVADWEAAAQDAIDAGIRTVLLRTSPVLDRSGGAFRLMRLAWSVGLAAKLGDGSQRMPMISLEDYLRVVLWAAGNESANGPYNLTIPVPATNSEFTETLARALRRPSLLTAPAPVLRAVLGDLADELVGDIHAVPQRLTQAGFSFLAPDVERTVQVALDRG